MLPCVTIFSIKQMPAVTPSAVMRRVAKGGGSNGGGSSYHDIFVNNTLYNNGTHPGNASEGGPTGEFQIQYQVGSAQGNIFENNIVYAGPYYTWIYSYVPFSPSYPAPPATAQLEPIQLGRRLRRGNVNLVG